MKKILILSVLLLSTLVLTGCKEETEPSKYIDNPEDYYCVDVVLDTEYCLESEEEFNNIFVRIRTQDDWLADYDEEDIPLRDYIEDFQYSPMYYIENVKIYERSYDVIHTGRYEIHTPQGDVIGDFDIDIILYEESHSYPINKDVTRIFNDTYCQFNQRDMFQYAVLINEKIYDLGILTYITDFDIKDINLEKFNCDLGTVTIDDVEYFYTHKTESFDIVSVEVENSEVVIEFYGTDTYCRNYFAPLQYESYVYQDNELIPLGDALDQELINSDEIWRYGLKECNGYTVAYYDLFRNEQLEDPEYLELSYEVNGYPLYFYNYAYDLFEEHQGVITYQIDDLYHSFVKAHLEGVFALLIDGEYITLNEAIEEEIINIEDLVDNEFVHVFTYGYYE